jgi:hypothetical protein
VSLVTSFGSFADPPSSHSLCAKGFGARVLSWALAYLLVSTFVAFFKEIFFVFGGILLPLDDTN